MTSPLDEKGLPKPEDVSRWNADAERQAVENLRASQGLSAAAIPDGLDWNRLRELIGEYFDLGYAEGAVQRDVDTMAGDAQRTFLEIEAIISQAQSAIAALRAERDEAYHAGYSARDRVVDACHKRAETAEAEVKRLTEENEALTRQVNAYAHQRDRAREERDKAEFRAESFWRPQKEAAEARIKALEETLKPFVEVLDDGWGSAHADHVPLTIVWDPDHIGGKRIPLRDFRTARATLSGSKKE